MKNILLILSLLFSICTWSQSPVGIWQTKDDNTGEAKSHVEISEKGGTVTGQIVKLLLSDPNSLCDKCKGEFKNKPVLGLDIIQKLKRKGEKWSGGTIMDPENGKSYKCSIWFEDEDAKTLYVRGKHWTGLYRTQTWTRVE